MEHIVQFAIGIDDDAIISRIEEYATKTIASELKQGVADKMFKRYDYYSGHADPKRDPLSQQSLALISEFLNEHRDVIVQKAADALATKMMASRTVRDKLKENI